MQLVRRVLLVLLVPTILLAASAVDAETDRIAGAAPAAMSSTELEFLRLLNQRRVGTGRAPLVHDAALANSSRLWSGTMAATNTLFHDVGIARAVAVVEPAWRSYGENVGYGGTVRWIHDAFIASTSHLTNAMSTRFNRVGIGAVQSGSRIWVTFRFLEGPAISGPTGLSGCTAPVTPTVAAVNVNGDRSDDLVVNGSGTACDTVLFGSSGRRFNLLPASVGDGYVPVAGDFDGDGRGNVLWYAPGGATDYLSRWNGSNFSSQAISIRGTYLPEVGDFDGDGRTDILWYAPGSAPDYFWYGTATPGQFDSRRLTVNGLYRVAVTDFDGDGRDDIVWHGPGSGPDFIHYSAGRGRHTSVRLVVNGRYEPFGGDFDGDGRGDVFWYAPGTAAEHVWYGRGARGSYESRATTRVNGTYAPLAGDFDGDGRSDIAWITSRPVGSPVWYGSSSRGQFLRTTVRTAS